MGRARGGISPASAALRESTEDAFGAVLGAARGSGGARERCSACGARDVAVSAGEDGVSRCQSCARTARAQTEFHALDTRLRALTDPVLAVVKDGTMQEKVDAHNQAEALVQAELDAIHARQNAQLKPGGDPELAELLGQMALRAHEHMASVKVVSWLAQKDENKLIRRELQGAFPGVKFSVSHRGGYGVRVSWTDGPAQGEVAKLTGRFASESHGLDAWGEHETRSITQYVLDETGRPVRVSSGSAPGLERRLSPEWHAELRAELAHLMGEPELALTTSNPQLDIDIRDGLMTPVSGMAHHRRPHLSFALEQAAKYRSRDAKGRVLMAGGCKYDGMTPWEAHNAERAQWDLGPLPEPDFSAAASTQSAPAAPASGEEPLSTVASLKRRLEIGVPLTCTAAPAYKQREVGVTRKVARLQGNLARLERLPGEDRSEELCFPSKAEFRVTGPDSFDVLDRDGSLHASYRVGPKPAKASPTSARFEHPAAKAHINKDGELTVNAPFFHGGRHAGTLRVEVLDGAYGELAAKATLDVGGFRASKFGFVKLALALDNDGRASVDWERSSYEFARPSAALRAHAEKLLPQIDAWVAAQRKAGRALAELKTANAAEQG